MNFNSKLFQPQDIQLAPYVCYIPNFGNKPANFPILITGDTLFIGSCGRFDQTRDGMKIFHSINRLSMLPDTTMVCPGHNYAGSNSSIGHEKKYNAAIMQGKQMKEQLQKAYGKHELKQSIFRCDTSATFESHFSPNQALSGPCDKSLPGFENNKSLP